MKKQECPFLSDAGVDVASPDNGIEICLNCPYERCVYEVTTQTYRRMQIRRAQVKVLRDEGKTGVEMAKILKVSEVTIWGDIKAIKEEK